MDRPITKCLNCGMLFMPTEDEVRNYRQHTCPYCSYAFLPLRDGAQHYQRFAPSDPDCINPDHQAAALAYMRQHEGEAESAEKLWEKAIEMTR
jgi:hypothetical protein